MFQRFTEKARRVILFARHEASTYGSRSIETEHLLLGLLREDSLLAKRFLGEGNVETEIRAEIEGRIKPGKPFSRELEIPVSNECKRIFNFASEASERLGHRWVGTEHLLIGILREKKSLAAQILTARGLEVGAVQEQIANAANTQ